MPKHWSVFYRGNRWNRRRPHHWLPMGKGMFYVLTGSGTYAMRYAPFRGISRAAFYGVGQSYFGPLRLANRVYEVLSVKKVKVAERSSVKHLAALESNMFREHMGVIEVLALLQYEDGSPREPGYLGMWTQGATWFVRLIDKTGEAQITAEGRTAEEAWDVLQLALGSDGTPWEPISRRQSKGARKSS